MRYLSESTQHLLSETAIKIVNTGKDPIFLIEAFIIKNKNKFNEGVLSDLWKDTKNWFKGGMGAVAAGRHDIEDEYNSAYKALFTMISHIRKFRGSDEDTEKDIIQLLLQTLRNMKSAHPMIIDLAGKVKKRAAAASDSSLWGGPEKYVPHPHINAADFGSINNVPIEQVGGTKPIMSWFANLKNTKNLQLIQSIIMNAKNRSHASQILSIAEKDYDNLLASTAENKLIIELQDIGIRDRITYGKIFAYLYQKYLAAKPPELKPEPKPLEVLKNNPKYIKEISFLNENETYLLLNHLLRYKNEFDEIKEIALADITKDLTKYVTNASKINVISSYIAKFKEENPGFPKFDEDIITRILIYLISKAQV